MAADGHLPFRDTNPRLDLLTSLEQPQEPGREWALEAAAQLDA